MRILPVVLMIGGMSLFLAGGNRAWADDPAPVPPPPEGETPANSASPGDKTADSGKPSEGEEKYSLEFDGEVRMVTGDEERFREIHQKNDKYNAGIKGSYYDQRPDRAIIKSKITGSYPDDYQLDFTVTKPDKSYIHLETGRVVRYYDGDLFDYRYFPMSGIAIPSGLVTKDSWGRELSLNRDRLLVEYGFIVRDFTSSVGYEFRPSSGKQSLTYGGIVNSPDNMLHYPLLPSYRKVNYDSHRVFGSVRYPWEVFTLNFTPDLRRLDGTAEVMQAYYASTQTFHSARTQRQILDTMSYRLPFAFEGEVLENGLCYLETGYEYEELFNDNVVRMDSMNSSGTRVYNEHALNYLDTNTHSGREATHQGHLQLTHRISDKLKFWEGVQYRQGTARNKSMRNEDGTGAGTDPTGPQVSDNVWNTRTLNRERALAESAGVTFKYLPKTTVDFKGEFEQGEVDYDWSSLLSGPTITAGSWVWDDVGHYRKYGPVMSVVTRPTHWWESFLTYRLSYRTADHSEEMDYAENVAPADQEYTMTGTNYYYPGTMGDTRLVTHDVQKKFRFQVASWLSFNPRLGFQRTEFDKARERDPVSAAERETYGGSLVIAPTPELTITPDVTHAEAFIGSRSARTLPGQGLLNNSRTGGYISSREYDYTLASCPVEYRLDDWKLYLTPQYNHEQGWITSERMGSEAGARYYPTKNTEVGVGYLVENYDEKGNGGWNEYLAHAVTTSFAMRW